MNKNQVKANIEIQVMKQKGGQVKREKYEKFFSFIDKKINDSQETRKIRNNTYKKTLFSSPHFQE